VSTATTSQWILLYGYVITLAVCTFFFLTNRRVRPVAFAVGFVALTHTVYYLAFLVYPGWLDGVQTMNFSIAIRFHILFTGIASLILTVLHYKAKDRRGSE
jgi:hypothetical protein